MCCCVTVRCCDAVMRHAVQYSTVLSTPSLTACAVHYTENGVRYCPVPVLFSLRLSVSSSL
jgi:hypothetical protein